MFTFESKELAISLVNPLVGIEEVLDDRQFFEELVSIKEFWNAEVTGIAIYECLVNAYQRPADVKIMGWKRFKPWYRNTTAETVGRVIELNPKFMNRDAADIANTLVHEWLHTIGFSHIWNNPKKYPIILKSVNYVVGNLVEKHVRRIHGN